MSVLYLVLLAFVFTNTDAARILAVYPTPSISHQVVFRPLTQELIKRGHEVVVVTTDPAFPRGQAPENLTEIDVHDFSYATWDEYVRMANGRTDDWLINIEIAINLIDKIFEDQMKTREVQEILFSENAHFDLLLVEAWVRPTLALSHIFKVPTITVSSFGGSVLNNFEVVGAPCHPFLYPSLLKDRLYNLSLWEKAIQFYKEIQLSYMLQSSEERENVVIKQLFGPKTPTLKELYHNIDMFFANAHPFWVSNRPVPPNVVFMGGLHQSKTKTLPKELQSYLDSSKNGVIYVSFGTNVQTSLLPLERINEMIKVFSVLPYDILWKWDKEELPGRSANIKISKWLPQADLLKHPKIKLFITQGGLQSTDEAITAGVPLIGIPMLGDQWYNVEKYVHHKIGLRLDMKTLNQQNLEGAIKTVIQDESYRENIARLREIMLDQPQRPLDRAVWWIEHVLRRGGGRHLRPPTANMGWAEYLEWDLACLLVTMLSLAGVVFYILVANVWKLLESNISNSIKIKKF